MVASLISFIELNIVLMMGVPNPKFTGFVAIMSLLCFCYFFL